MDVNEPRRYKNVLIDLSDSATSIEMDFPDQETVNLIQTSGGPPSTVSSL